MSRGGKHGKFSKNRGGGGRGGGGRGGRGGGGGGANGRTYEDNRQSFDQIPKHNERLERFYNTLGVVPAGEQRDAFWAALRRELPNSFRFTGSKGHALGVRDNLVNRFFPLIATITHEGKPVELPRPMPWYPEGLAYSMTTPKNVVRKYEPFKEFQRFLVSETGVGNISRQEHVSMIPPLLMDIRPHHAVLDLCAAPGSKSAQLVEAIHAGEEDRVAAAIKAAAAGGASDASHDDDFGRSTGLLVANDVNYQRAQMLVHQVKRLNSPNLIVTNHDATMFPSIELPSAAPAPGQPKKGKYLKFDRILADVPCSGDGTARKNPTVWKDWTPQNGLGLYITQVRILTRALQMLKTGGRVVYSTCSMNPVENEAVVSSAIERCGGAAKVQLLDCSAALPGLVRSPGLTDWSIMSRGGQIYESFAEAVQFESEESKIVPGMFAPEPVEQIPLERCIRVYPHQQDTGGFFIAVLEKLSEIRAKPESEAKCMDKSWSFAAQEAEPETPAEPVSAPAEPTMFQKLLDEVDHPSEPVETEAAATSAAARQNSDGPTSAQASAALKRKADELASEDSEAKRARSGDATGDTDLTVATDRPLPPSVAMAVAASGAEPSAPVAKAVPSDIRPPRSNRRRNGEDAPNEESFKYLAEEHPELQAIVKFYELHASFPRDRFLVRNPAGDPVKGIYYSSALVKDILSTNEGRGMKFVHAGVKMFMKQEAQGPDTCRWRIQTEGLPLIEGWTSAKRGVRLWRRRTLRTLLVEMFPKLAGPPGSPEAAALGEVGPQVARLPMGCCVLRAVVAADVPIDEEYGLDGDEGFTEPLVLPLWRSAHSLNLMLPKEERRAMLLRLFNEDVELVNHSKGATKGSVPAETEAREVERRMEAAGPDDAGTAAAVAAAATVPDEVNENGVDLAAEAREQDLASEQDRAQAQTLAEREDDEDKKVTDAMPERAGEGDEANKTV